MMGERESQTILVTGGAGFIGLNFIPYFLEKYPHVNIVNLDKLTYAANVAEVKKFAQFPNYHFVEGDICDRELIEDLFAKHDMKGVIHFAAESHVDRSIADPDIFIKTNIHGTFTLLEAAMKHWMKDNGHYRPGYESCRFHHISTDEVYGTLGPDGLFTEKTPYAPNSPYSASKASSDMIVRSYYHTYGMNVITTNCSNNYGPKQHSEKLIPTIIRKALKLERIPIYGDGKNVRDWLFVLDHCKGIDLAFHKGQIGETYNIGGKNERTNIYIAKKICDILDEVAPSYKRGSIIKKYEELIDFVSDRPGHDRRYAIDAGKAEKELGWHAEETFESGLYKTVEWYAYENH
jgi:dTDP-glucose 4,6-dehydratase